MEALSGDQSIVKKIRDVFKERRDIAIKGLREIRGMSCVDAEGAFSRSRRAVPKTHEPLPGKQSEGEGIFSDRPMPFRAAGLWTGALRF